MKYLFAILFVLSAACLAQTNPLPLGLVSNPQSASCTGFSRNATCEQITVTCPSVAPLNVIVGTVVGTNKKTIFLMNGSKWTEPGMMNYASRYIDDGYTVVQASWASAWQAPGTGYTPNMLNAACRPATLLNYAANGSVIGVQAGSGGAGAFAYAMAWYGLAGEVAVAEITSGPVYADIEQGCEVARAPDVTIVPTNGTSWDDQPWYSNGVPPVMTEYTGYTCLPTKGNTPGTSNEGWLAQSVNALGAFDSYSTYVSAWLCQTDQATNNSAAQGYLWLSKVASPWQLTAMTGCAGDEDVDAALTPQGETGFAALVADIEARF